MTEERKRFYLRIFDTVEISTVVIFVCVVIVTTSGILGARTWSDRMSESASNFFAAEDVMLLGPANMTSRIDPSHDYSNEYSLNTDASELLIHDEL